MIYECRRWWQSHRWSAWSEPRDYRDNNMPEGCVGQLQHRECARCKAVQKRAVDRLFRGSSYDAGKHADYHTGSA